MMYNQVEYVDPGKIKIHPDVQNVRSKINKTDCRDLMASIKERGVQNPITVFRLNGDIYLVSGERRLSSVRWLAEEDPRDKKFKSVPVLVKNYGEDLEKLVRNALYDNLIENIQREDLNGVDIAVRVKELMERGMDKQEICQEIGKSITWVNETLKFLEADPAVQEEVKRGNLTLDEGRKVAKLPPEKQAKVALGLSQAKEIEKDTGDKSAKKAIKKGIEQATRTRSNVAPSKKEIGYAANACGEILAEMKKLGDTDTKVYVVISTTFSILQWALGNTRDLGIDRLLKKYKIKVGSDGVRVRDDAKPKPKPKSNNKSKAKPKAKAKAKGKGKKNKKK